jgi:hypothetical protein
LARRVDNCRVKIEAINRIAQRAERLSVDLLYLPRVVPSVSVRLLTWALLCDSPNQSNAVH